MTAPVPFEKDGKLYLPWLWLRNEGLLAWRDAYGPKEIVYLLFDNPHRCPAIEQFSGLHMQDIIVEKWLGPMGGLKGYVISRRQAQEADHGRRPGPSVGGEGSLS